MGDRQMGLARRGDATAIAQLIQRAILNQAIQVKVLREKGDLQVLLESSRLPDRQLARIVYTTLLGLGAPTLESLKVSGRQGQQTVWTQKFLLEDGAAAIGNRRSVSHQAAVSHQALESDRPIRPLAVPHFPFPAFHPKTSFFLLLTIFTSFLAGIGLSYFSQRQTYRQSYSQRYIQTKAAELTSARVALTPELATRQSHKPSPTFSPSVPSPSPISAEPIISIKAVGDIVPGTNFPGDRLPADGGQWLFDEVKPFLSGADILFGNFESTLTDYPYAAKDMSQGMTFAFRTPPAFANVLKDAGFNVLSVANNHSFDFSDQGFTDTIANIEQSSMKAIGQKGQISYLTVKGVAIAFIGFSYLPDHNWMLDLDMAQALVDQGEVPDAESKITAWASSFTGSSHSYICSSGLTKPPEVLAMQAYATHRY